MPRENRSRYAVLGALSFAPRSGYDLKKFMQRSTGYFWNEDFSQIYPMLKQLEQEGLTTSYVEKQTGKPDRRIYQLTELGKDELLHWLSTPVTRQVVRNELLLKLFLGPLTTEAISIEHVQQYRQFLSDLLQRLEQVESSLTSGGAQRKERAYWLMTVSYGRHEIRAKIAWCDETIASLQQMAED